jgi:hypothetical protein
MAHSSRAQTHSDRPLARRAARRRSLFAAAPLLLAALVAAAAPAQAQSQADKAASDKLYQEGLAKMLESKFDVGCPKLAESQRLFPRPGTLFTLAECEAKAGRAATAIGHYQEYMKLFSEMDPDQQSKQREKQRDTISQAQISALSKTAPRLTIAVAGSPSGLSVKLDGAAVEASRFGAEIPVDPGEHVVTWEGGSGSPSEAKITLAAGEKKQVDIGSALAGDMQKGTEPSSESVFIGPERPAHRGVRSRWAGRGGHPCGRHNGRTGDRREGHRLRALQGYRGGGRMGVRRDRQEGV